MAGTKATKAAGASKDETALRDILLSRVPAEDLAGYDAAVLDRAAHAAFAAVSKHNKGEAVIDLAVADDLKRGDRPLTVITVVNDNMPFLFDSVMGEVTELAGEPALVVHPVLKVEHGKTGVTAIVADAGHARGEHAIDKVSVIHIHVGALTAEQRAGLSERLERLLAQVKSAVQDWKPMLARLDRAISDFRYAPIPLDRDSVTEAIAFLEWLRDDNFTFLGMREFTYSGGEKSGMLEAKAKGLGILADPNILVLRRDAEGSSTTPEIRAFLHAPEPLIVTKLVG